MTKFAAMPLLTSTYQPPFLFRNYHISTIYASLVRKAPAVVQTRERLELPDGDFLDLDWSYASSMDSHKLLIILHGLEGNSQRPYVLGMAGNFNRSGWDVAAINFRGCSGALNRLYRSYNAGASEDLREVILHSLSKGQYEEIALTGFSLGGNLMLKYLGEGKELSTAIKAAVAISTPCDLYASLKKLEEPGNRIYSGRFVKKLKQQLLIRESAFPEQLERQQILACKSLYAIDELYTGKAHGYESAREYYQKCSALQFIPSIKIPTLLINAQNDAFLSDNSSPAALAQDHSFFHLEMPKYGGHVGFLQHKKTTYAEDRALEFVTQQTQQQF